MKISLFHPIQHGEGKQVTEYSRGVYQTDDPKADAYIPLKLSQDFLKQRNCTTGEPWAVEYKPEKPVQGRAETVGIPTRKLTGERKID